MNKVFCLLALAFSLAGCSTLNTAATKVTPQQVTLAASALNLATKDGVQLLIQKHPEYTTDITLADKALNAFIAAGGTDPAKLQASIDAVIPANDQADAQPIVDGVVALYASYVTPWLASQPPSLAATYAVQLLTAIDAGLNAALAPAATPMLPLTSAIADPALAARVVPAPASAPPAST